MIIWLLAMRQKHDPTQNGESQDDDRGNDKRKTNKFYPV